MRYEIPPAENWGLTAPSRLQSTASGGFQPSQTVTRPRTGHWCCRMNSVSPNSLSSRSGRVPRSSSAGTNNCNCEENLPCVLSRKWSIRRYGKSGRGYVNSLSDIQSRVRHVLYPEGPKTLAKAIDEFHYVNITLPIQRIENEQNATGKTEKGKRREALRRLGRKLSLDELEQLARTELD